MNLRRVSALTYNKHGNNNHFIIICYLPHLFKCRKWLHECQMINAFKERLTESVRLSSCSSSHRITSGFLLFLWVWLLWTARNTFDLRCELVCFEHTPALNFPVSKVWENPLGLPLHDSSEQGWKGRNTLLQNCLIYITRNIYYK